MAWPYAMTSYAISGTKSGIDIISASTPIQKLTETVSSNLFQKDGFSLLQELGFQISKTDKSITNYLNTVLFNDFKSNLPYGFFDFLFGARGSTIIESGLFIIILGTIILFAFGYYKYITSFLATFVFLSLVFIFGLGLPGEELLHGNVLLALVNHGILPAMLVFGIFPENSCISRWGQLVFGLILGFILYFTLRFKTGSSGVFLSICIANLLMILIKNRRLSLYNAQGNGNEK
jgi:Na+-translocating ferredoxin:NAD+ oxidoreductase RnfD subunit